MRVPPGSQLVFDQVLQSGANGAYPPITTLAFSDPKFNDWLGRGNELALFVVVDRATDSGGLIVFTQETSDEEVSWYFSYGEGAPIPGLPFTSPGVTLLTGADTEAGRFPSGRPSLGYRRLAAQIGAGASGVTFSAHVRIWAVGRNGYRKFNRLLLKERVEGTTAIYAPHEACAGLAGVDELTFGMLTDEVAGTAPTATILLAESPNGRTWNQGSSAPISISSGVLQAVAGAIQSGPLSGFLRFGLVLGGTSPAATVRLWVTGRDVRSG